MNSKTLGIGYKGMVLNTANNHEGHQTTHLEEILTMCVLHWTSPQLTVFSSDQLLLSILLAMIHSLTRALKCKPSAGDMIIKKPED